MGEPSADSGMSPDDLDQSVGGGGGTKVSMRGHGLCSAH